MDTGEHVGVRETLPPVRAGQTDLSAAETRVLGSMIEKQRTTPDQYPLTLNALRLACNQATNRDPVVEYDDGKIREALHKLERRGLVRLASGRGSRAPKYRHLLADALPMDADERTLMCVLMLRGAQTPGELKQRSERMHAFAGLAAVAQTLERLIARGLAQRLPRRPGQKEERFRELLTSDGSVASAAATQLEEMRARAGADAASRPRGPVDEPGSQPQAAQAVAGVSSEAFEELRARVERLERDVEAMRSASSEQDLGEPPAEPVEWPT